MTSVFGDGSPPSVLIGKKGNLQKKDTEQKPNALEENSNMKNIDIADTGVNSKTGGEVIVGSIKEPIAFGSNATKDSEMTRDDATEKLKISTTENDNSEDMQGSLLVVYSSSNDSCTSEDDT